jgi:hypothetical protein
MAAANRGMVPLDLALASGDDAITQRNLETGERALLYVAITRQAFGADHGIWRRQSLPGGNFVTRSVISDCEVFGSSKTLWFSEADRAVRSAFHFAQQAPPV